MPRPRKGKKVCCLPETNLYGPLKPQQDDNKIVLMSVEEYETIRLIDLEKLTQEECGERMQVARTTIQKIYTDARAKVAESLVNGCFLKIEGGDYQLYSEIEKPMGCGRCRRSRCGRDRIGGPLNPGSDGFCICHSCGTKVEHIQAKPCNTLKCPQCGATMARN